MTGAIFRPIEDLQVRIAFLDDLVDQLNDQSCASKRRNR